jgi:small subunit ribosomal protein S16
MATRIRLQRHGRKGRPIFTIVVADSRSKRDGKNIENLGQYNPNTNPATITLNFDRTLEWIMKGAIPSDTARAILKYRGVMMKKHLLKGVLKGALTEQQAEERFEKWMTDKAARIDKNIDSINSSDSKKRSEILKAESIVKEKRAAQILAKNTPSPKVSDEEISPVDQNQEAAAETKVEEATPEAKAGEVTPEVSTEEATPEASAEGAAPEVSTEEATPEASAEEATPEASTEEATPEASAEEATPEASAEEATPEASTEETAPEASAEEATPEASAEEATPEASAQE